MEGGERKEIMFFFMRSRNKILQYNCLAFHLPVGLTLIEVY